MSNWEEWVAGTVANDADSVLSITDSHLDASGLWVIWASQPGKEYVLETMTPPSPWEQVSTNGQPLVIVGDSTGTTASNRIPRSVVEQKFVRIRIR
jgi:hypothetical protein